MDELSKHNFETQDCCECSNYDEDQFEDENKRNKITFDKVSSAESYLEKRRILKLIHFMLTKLVADAPEKPVLYLEKLLEDCIGFLAYRNKAPTLYETRHFEAALRSFDPGDRGWINSCQVRRFYESFGLETNENDQVDYFKVGKVLEDIQKKQELALRELLAAGSVNQ